MDTTTTAPTFVTKWGSFRSGDGVLYRPGGVATDASNNVYVADTGNHRVQKFGQADTTAPYVTAVSPRNSATNVPKTANVTATFSEPVQGSAPPTSTWSE